VLVLLIIFMVVAPRLEQDVQVDLPGIFNPDPEVDNSADPLKVTVAKAGEYYIDSEKYDLDGAIGHLADEHTLNPARRVILRADTHLRYKDVRAIFNRVQEVGFPGVALMVGERHRSTDQQPPHNRGEERLTMAMTVGMPKGRASSQPMNVTPLVDVVLVLLIILHVVTPLLSKQFWVHTPRQQKEEVTREELAKDPTPPLVLRVGAGRTVTVNGTDVAVDELVDRPAAHVRRARRPCSSSSTPTTRPSTASASR